MEDIQDQDLSKTELKDFSAVHYPQFDNNYPSLQNPGQLYPTQQFEPPPSYAAQHYPIAEPQPVQVVIQRQPQKIVASNDTGGYAHSYIGFSVTCLVLTALCAWPLLLCTIPALILSILSMSKSSERSFDTARTYGKLALGFNISAIVGFVVIVIIIIIIET